MNYDKTTITPKILERIEIGDWIEGIGTISCPFERNVVRRMGTWLRKKYKKDITEIVKKLSDLKKEADESETYSRNGESTDYDYGVFAGRAEAFQELIEMLNMSDPAKRIYSRG